MDYGQIIWLLSYGGGWNNDIEHWFEGFSTNMQNEIQKYPTPIYLSAI